MPTTNKFIKRMKDYRNCMNVLSCTNYIYLDEISNFEFKKISKYSKSKNLYNKITSDFKLVNELLDKKDLLNSATILRTLYENIIYIIAKSYDKDINITLDTAPRDLRKILEDNCEEIFTDYFEKKDFNEIYKYLCKIVHPCSMKELLSYMSKTIKYRDYLLGNIKYIMIIIEYMYLNFLNKKKGKEENEFDLNLIYLSTYINLVNIGYFINEIRDSKGYIKRFFYYDTNNRYITDNQEELKEIYDTLITKKELVEKDVKELTKEVNKQIKESKYNETINKILNE